jgi:hemoglobin-like flavoprotein
MLAAVKRTMMKRRDGTGRVVDKVPSKKAAASVRRRMPHRTSPETDTDPAPSPPGSVSDGSSRSGPVKLDCTTQIYADQIDTKMVTSVVTSWEKGILAIPKWYALTGETFVRKIFELDPSTIKMFGFPEDTKYDDPSLSKSRKFMDKAVKLIKAVDMAIGFLGPDLEPLQDTLYDLGKRHAAMGCKPEHWPVVGKALFYAFEKHMLGGFKNDELRDSWTLVYNFLSYHMIQGLNAKYDSNKLEKREPRALLHHPEPAPENKLLLNQEPVQLPPRPYLKKQVPTTEIKLDCTQKVLVSQILVSQVTTVVSSWDKMIKSIPSWNMVTGELFLRKIIQRNQKTAVMFGFPEDTRHDDPKLSENRKFMMKGYTLIKAIDMAVGCLGPDLSAMERELFALGKRHVVLNCRPSQWEGVGLALFDVLDEYMGDAFTQESRYAWSIMYRFWGYHMIQGLIYVKPEWRGQ